MMMIIKKKQTYGKKQNHRFLYSKFQVLIFNIIINTFNTHTHTPPVDDDGNDNDDDEDSDENSNQTRCFVSQILCAH